MKTDTETMPDYKLAAQELAALFETMQLEAAAHGGDEETDDKGWKHRAWRVTVRRVGTGSFCKPATFDWKAGMGLKGKPNGAKVLARICSEHLEAMDAGRFEAWADGFGMDTDSREAESIYRACLDHVDKLAGLRLTRAEMRQLADLSNRL
jgi:hypothetical protein